MSTDSIHIKLDVVDVTISFYDTSEIIVTVEGPHGTVYETSFTKIELSMMCHLLSGAPELLRVILTQNAPVFKQLEPNMIRLTFTMHIAELPYTLTLEVPRKRFIGTPEDVGDLMRDSAVIHKQLAMLEDMCKDGQTKIAVLEAHLTVLDSEKDTEDDNDDDDDEFNKELEQKVVKLMQEFDSFKKELSAMQVYNNVLGEKISKIDTFVDENKPKCAKMADACKVDQIVVKIHQRLDKLESNMPKKQSKLLDCTRPN